MRTGSIVSLLSARLPAAGWCRCSLTFATAFMQRNRFTDFRLFLDGTFRSLFNQSWFPGSGVAWCHFVARLRLCLSPLWLRDKCSCHKKDEEELIVNFPCRKLTLLLPTFCQFLSIVPALFWENNCRVFSEPCQLLPLPLGRPSFWYPKMALF